MEWSIKCAYVSVLYGALGVIILTTLYRMHFYKHPVYTYPLTSLLIKSGYSVSVPYKKILHALRLISLLIMAFLVSRPQMVDQLSKVNVEGIDIMLALDVSGSMQLFDSVRDPRRRIDVAKEEAIAFIKKRDNDPVGLVLFGNEAVSRCPLTLDKKMLASIISDVELGIINPEGTMITRGVVMALNRMRKSPSKTKIIILLTDGEPTEGDLDPRSALEMAKKMGVKIYTIGIGGNEGGFYQHPVFGIQQARAPLNKNLLQALATGTGGRFFEATNPAELATIYDTINNLEKTSYETDVYYKYYEIFMPFLWCVLAICFLELFLSRFMWSGLGL